MIFPPQQLSLCLTVLSTLGKKRLKSLDDFLHYLVHKTHTDSHTHTSTHTHTRSQPPRPSSALLALKSFSAGSFFFCVSCLSSLFFSFLLLSHTLSFLLSLFLSLPLPL